MVNLTGIIVIIFLLLVVINFGNWLYNKYLDRRWRRMTARIAPSDNHAGYNRNAAPHDDPSILEHVLQFLLGRAAG